MKQNLFFAAKVCGDPNTYSNTVFISVDLVYIAVMDKDEAVRVTSIRCKAAAPWRVCLLTNPHLDGSLRTRT